MAASASGRRLRRAAVDHAAIAEKFLTAYRPAGRTSGQCPGCGESRWQLITCNPSSPYLGEECRRLANASPRLFLNHLHAVCRWCRHTEVRTPVAMADDIRKWSGEDSFTIPYCQLCGVTGINDEGRLLWLPCWDVLCADCRAACGEPAVCPVCKQPFGEAAVISLGGREQT